MRSESPYALHPLSLSLSLRSFPNVALQTVPRPSHAVQDGAQFSSVQFSLRWCSVQFISVQFKVVSMRSEKPICAPPSLSLSHSEVSPTLLCKRSQDLATQFKLVLSLVQFSSVQGSIYAPGKAHMRSTSLSLSQKFPQRCLANGPKT